jgi:hypothetical protein
MDVEKIKPNKQLGSSPGNLFGDWKKRFRLTERKKNAIYETGFAKRKNIFLIIYENLKFFGENVISYIFKKNK